MAIPKPEPSDWQKANAQVLQATDREVLAMLRDSYGAVQRELRALIASEATNLSAGIRRAQLEASRSRLMAEQAKVFDRLGDIVGARRLRAASRAAQLSVAADSALLKLVGKGETAQILYDAALNASSRAIEVAMARLGGPRAPLSQRIYNTRVWMDGRLGRLINATLASGLNAKTFAKTARDWFNPNTPGGVRYAALRLARTEINNAFHAISVQKAADKPWVNEMDWNLSKSHPKPDKCNVLADASPYPADNVPMRPHPQCMCYVTEKTIGEDEWIDRFLEGEFDDYLDAELEKAGVTSDPEPEKVRETTLTPRKVWDLWKKQGGLEVQDRSGDWKVIGEMTLGSGGGSRSAGARGGQWTISDVDGNKILSASPNEGVRTRSIRQHDAGDETPELLTGQEALDSVPKGLFKRGSMTPKQRKQLKTYETGWFAVINFFLRGGMKIEDTIDKQTLQTVMDIDSAMDGSVLPGRVRAWRGMHHGNLVFGDDRFKGDLTGFSWKELGYGSVTANESITKDFRLEGEKDNVHMVITVDAGVKGLVTSDFTHGSKDSGPQAEITLQRNLAWKVTKDNGVNKSTGFRDIEVTVSQADAGADADGAGRGATVRLPDSSPQRAEPTVSASPKPVGILQTTYGDRIHVLPDSHETAQTHIADLEKIPDSFHRVVSRAMHRNPKGGIFIGDKAVPELSPESASLRGVQPRGWAKGQTWDIVPGAFSPANFQLLLGGGAGHSHGSASLATHEFGHAFWSSVVPDDREDFRRLYYRLHGVANMSPYFSSKGNPDGFLSEGFAETFGSWAISRQGRREEAIARIRSSLGVRQRTRESNLETSRIIGEMIDLFEGWNVEFR